MKSFTKPFSLQWILLTISSTFILFACEKQIDQSTKQEEIAVNAKSNINGHLHQTKTYSSEVAFKWIDMQLRLFRTNATPIGGLPPQRFYAYSAIALYESVVPGMPAYRPSSGQLTDMPVIPATTPGYS
jgi:hypothetical protein